MNRAAILQKLVHDVGSERRLWVGFSGGLDSTVLLHLLANSSLYSQLHVVHVHHALSSHADAWATHCKNICEQLNLTLRLKRVHVDKTQKGVENAAREARYQAFSELLDNRSVLVLGHHQNDQVETILYRLARGAGIGGLAGMPAERMLGEACVARPLIDCDRKSLEAYAESKNLVWIEDESNESVTFDRNYIRKTIVPEFEARWPQFVTKVCASAKLVAEQYAVLNEYLDADLTQLGRRKERVGQSIDLPGLCVLSAEKQKALIRYWCEVDGLATPNSAHLAKLHEVLEAKEDASPCLSWGDAELRRFNQRVYLVPKRDWTALPAQSWDGRGVLGLGQGFSLTRVGKGEREERLTFEVSARKSAERCKPMGRNHSQTVKKLLQEYRLEPWLRELVPCIYLDGTLIAVGDLWVCETEGVDFPIAFVWQFSA